MQPRDFINKNWFRNYPIRGGCSCVTIDGKHLPTDFLVAAKLNNTYLSDSLPDEPGIQNGGISNPFISRIVVHGRVVSLTVSLLVDSAPVALWYGQAEITADNTAIPLEFNSAMFGGAGGGSVVVGNMQTVLDNEGSFIFDTNSALLEPSCHFVTPHPSVTAIIVKGRRLTGHVLVATDNVSSSFSATEETCLVGLGDATETVQCRSYWNLGIISPQLVESRRDRTVNRFTCATNAIKQINSVSPDGSGNIDIFGIEPVHVSVAGFGVTLSSPDVGFDTICPPVIVPKLLASNDYIGSILTVTEPEWKLHWDTPNYTP